MNSQTPLTSNHPQFWEQRYAAASTPWDLGEVAPPLKHYWESEVHPDLYTGQTMAVVGCGTGNDAAYFARQGFNVTGLDFAALAIQSAKQQFGELANFQQVDIFHLPKHLIGQFQVVLEHTCFCAIRPSDRPAYVQSAAELLQAQGLFLGLFWDTGERGGPPYATSSDDIEAHFSAQFKIHFLKKTPYSTPSRYHQEWLALMQKL